jgi:predicted nucleic acid-binding protein
MTVVGASVWIDFFRNTPPPQVERLSRLIGAQDIVIGDLILTEVLQGLRSDRDFRRARDGLLTPEYRDMAGRGIALAAAQDHRLLRARGVTVRKTIDVVIATFCIASGMSLLHDDRDFDAMRDHLRLALLEV